MKLLHLREMIECLAAAHVERTEAWTALHETGWLGSSGEGIGGDIRGLAKAWADAEVRAAVAEAHEAAKGPWSA